MRKRMLSTFLAAALLGWLAPEPALAQQSTEDLKKEIEALKEGIKSIQKDLQEIKTLLRQRQAAAPAQNVELDLGDNPSKGERTAKLTLVEFSDYQ